MVIKALPWMFAFALTGCPLKPLDVAGTGGSGGTGGTMTTSSSMTLAGCTMAPDCDDENPCTVDTCKDGVCSYSFADAGTPCPDSNECNGAETCDGKGVCVAGIPSPTCGTWAALPTDGAPLARTDHTAVWTGSEMIVWGGDVAKADDPAGITATGARYNPAQKKWTATSTTGAPSARHSHTAVWTGSKMIVWGGFGTGGFEASGGVYDPATDAWTALPSAGALVGRVQLTSVWTGAEMIVWGGSNAGAPLADGAAYDLAADTWTPLPAGPSPRFNHGAVWTGAEMLVWGGNDLSDWHQDGRFYDPASDMWTGTTTTAGAPSARDGHVSLWTGSQMLVWGGFDGGMYVGTGGAFDVASGAWSAITDTGAPSGRQNSAAVWTGSQMFVWGGCGGDSCFTTLDDGGVWIPGENGGAWEAIPSGVVASQRIGATAVWTGSQVIVWGGKAGVTGKRLGDGAQSQP